MFKRSLACFLLTMMSATLAQAEVEYHAAAKLIFFRHKDAEIVRKAFTVKGLSPEKQAWEFKCDDLCSVRIRLSQNGRPAGDYYGFLDDAEDFLKLVRPHLGAEFNGVISCDHPVDSVTQECIIMSLGSITW